MKKILVPMLECGAGHKMPALAVKESLERLYPGSYQVDVIDFAKAVGAERDDRSIKWAWDYGLAHPFWAKLGYRVQNGIWPLSMLWPEYVYPEFKRKAIEYVEAYKPDLIFSTNFFSSTMSAVVRGRLGLEAEVVSYVTDPFDAYGWWIDKRLDYICVASDIAADQLRARHFPEEKIRVLPFPIHRKFFSAKEDPAALRKRLGLREGVPTILTSEGGQGIGKISGFVLKLHERDFPCNVISICGKNEALRAELAKVAASRPSATNLIPLGFVDNMNELLGLADLCVAKAGASTTFEALLKGLPILFASWATYSERPNVDFCVERGIGWYTPDFESFSDTLDRLLAKGELAAAREKLASLKLHSGSDDVARFLHERIEAKGRKV